MWIAFNRVSRWPLLFSRKNHHNETASLPVSIPSLSPREKISRRGGTLRNELSLLPFLTRELFRLFWMGRWIGRGRDSASMPSILGNGEALEERVNCDELGWGGERERGVSSSVYLSARFLIIFIEISLTDSWKSPEIYAFFLSQINSGVEISRLKERSLPFSISRRSNSCQFLETRISEWGTLREKYIYNSREFSYSNLKMSRRRYCTAVLYRTGA